MPESKFFVRRAPSLAACRGALYWACLVGAISVFVYAALVRLDALKHWHADPARYFVNERPVMATADAYYSLRYAQMYRDGVFRGDEVDPRRHYQRLQLPVDIPLYARYGAEKSWMPQRQPKRLPLLSRLLALSAPLAGGLDMAAIYVPPMLAGLFVVPLFVYAWRIGQPAAGLLGGLVGAFSSAYYLRTVVGWSDTDCLNLFFPWLASLAVLSAHAEVSRRGVMLYAGLLGLVLNAYFQWYDKPAVSALYWGTLCLHLFLQRRPLTLILGALAVCVLCSHPAQMIYCAENFLALAGRYFGNLNPADGVSFASQWFPNVMQTVVEFRDTTWVESLRRVLSSPALAGMGCLFFVGYAVRSWRAFVPLLPLLLFAASTFLSGPRFGMYLAPFVGMGLGFAIAWITAYGYQQVLGKRASTLGAGAHNAIACGIAVILFFVALKPLTAHGVLGRSMVLSTDAMQALDRAATRMPRNAPVFTWWDFGFALAYLNNFTVYHDGAAQYTPQTNVIAHGLMSDDQAVLARIMAFVDTRGNAGIAELARAAGSRTEFLSALEDTTAPARDTYLLFMRNMLDGASALRYVAGLTTETAKGKSIFYEQLACQDLARNTLQCTDFSVNLESGSFSDGRTVHRLDIVDNGRVVKSRDYAHTTEYVLQIVIGANRQIDVYLLPNALYRSNLNQMFLLGHFDTSLFEEVYREVPTLRVFRQKQ